MRDNEKDMMNKDEKHVKDILDDQNEPEMEMEAKATEGAPPEVENNGEITSIIKERDEMKALLQRLQAEFDNNRKRNSMVRADAYDDGVRECIAKLLPVLDNLDRAVLSADTESEDKNGGESAALAEGVKLVQRQFVEVIGKLGVEEIPTENMLFDPNLHDAVMSTPAEEGQEEGYVAEVIQKGYRMGEKIIRHSMVRVTC